MVKKEVKDWITVNGKHIPLFEGESKQDAINRVIAKDNEDKKDSDINRNKKEADELNHKSVSHKNLDNFNNDALQKIIHDTGYDTKSAKKFQQTLWEYLGGDYESFSAGKRSDDVKVIDNGLSKMPKYNGDVHRGMYISDYTKSQFANLKVGDTLNMNSISSWTKDGGVAERYSSPLSETTSTVMLHCKNNKSGVDMTQISKWAGSESEILLPSSAKWKVKEVKTKNKYDYLKDVYSAKLADAKKPKSLIIQKTLNDLEKDKDKYKRVIWTDIILEEK